MVVDPSSREALVPYDRVLGDPTVASAEKGRAIFEKVIDRMVELVREFKARPVRPRRDQH